MVEQYFTTSTQAPSLAASFAAIGESLAHASPSSPSPPSPHSTPSSGAPSSVDSDIARLLALQAKHPTLTSSDSDSIRTFLQSWINYKTTGVLSLHDCINADTRTALELVCHDQLYTGRLSRFDEHLEPFLRSIIPPATLDEILPYFDAQIRMTYASTNAFHAHTVTAYNAYWNRFMAGYGLFQTFFTSRLLENPRAAMRLIQRLFVQGLQPRVVRELMDREVDLRSLEALRKRFDYVLGHIRQAHIENGPCINNNNNLGHNNRTHNDNAKTPARTPPTLPVVGSTNPRPGEISATSPRPGYVPKYQAAGGAKVNAVSTRAKSPPPPTRYALSLRPLIIIILLLLLRYLTLVLPLIPSLIKTY